MQTNLNLIWYILGSASLYPCTWRCMRKMYTWPSQHRMYYTTLLCNSYWWHWNNINMSSSSKPVPKLGLNLLVFSVIVRITIPHLDYVYTCSSMLCMNFTGSLTPQATSTCMDVCMSECVGEWGCEWASVCMSECECVGEWVCMSERVGVWECVCGCVCMFVRESVCVNGNDTHAYYSLRKST